MSDAFTQSDLHTQYCGVKCLRDTLTAVGFEPLTIWSLYPGSIHCATRLPKLCVTLYVFPLPGELQWGSDDTHLERGGLSYTSHVDCNTPYELHYFKGVFCVEVCYPHRVYLRVGRNTLHTNLTWGLKENSLKQSLMFKPSGGETI